MRKLLNPHMLERVWLSFKCIWNALLSMGFLDTHSIELNTGTMRILPTLMFSEYEDMGVSWSRNLTPHWSTKFAWSKACLLDSVNPCCQDVNEVADFHLQTTSPHSSFLHPGLSFQADLDMILPRQIERQSMLKCQELRKQCTEVVYFLW